MIRKVIDVHKAIRLASKQAATNLNDMGVSMLRTATCLLILMVYPISLIAADSQAAMLHTSGTTWLNGSSVPKSAAVFAGDIVQTKTDSVASINTTGTTVAVLNDSVVTFNGAQGLGLSRGGMNIATSNKMPARVGQLTVTPVANAWTEFQLMQSGDKVQVVARKGSLNVTDASGTTTLAAGQQATRFFDDRKGGGAAPAAGGGLLDSPVFFYVGVAAVAGVLTWVLVQGSKPFSPAQP